MIGTGIKLNGISFGNENLPRIVDYQDVIANASECVGAWRFDRNDYLELDSGGLIDVVKSWRTDGPDLTLSSTNKASLVNDAELGRQVAQFGDSVSYTAPGLISTATPLTMVAVVKLADIEGTSREMIMGNLATVDDSKNLNTTALNAVSGDAILRSSTSDETGSVTVEQIQGYLFVIHSVNAELDTQLEVNVLPPVSFSSNTSLAAQIDFNIGNNNQSFNGRFDFVALFSADVDNLPLLSDLREYLSVRAGLS